MSSPYVRRLRLGMEIRALRDERAWTQARLARLADMTRSDLSKLENGQAVDLADALNLLDALGVEGERWTALSAIARDTVTPGWWDSVKHIGERQALYASLEYDATTIRQFQQAYPPGLLQLPDYVRSFHAAEEAFGPSSVPVEGFLAGRMGRQRNLRLPGSPLPARTHGQGTQATSPQPVILVDGSAMAGLVPRGPQGQKGYLTDFRVIM